MKIISTTLLASIFSVATATAQPLTPNEIFSAIDGEYNHVSCDKLIIFNCDIKYRLYLFFYMQKLDS